VVSTGECSKMGFERDVEMERVEVECGLCRGRCLFVCSFFVEEGCLVEFIMNLELRYSDQAPIRIDVAKGVKKGYSKLFFETRGGKTVWLLWRSL
jgi:hypothetical protein